METNSKHTEGKLSIAMGGTQIWANNVTTICHMQPNLPASKANAKRIVEIWNNWDEMRDNLERILDRIKENDLQTLFPSAYMRAKDFLNNISKTNQQ